MITANEDKFLEMAIELSRAGMEQGKGGPFGCVIVHDSRVIAEGFNMVIAANDPTAHAEIVAIRKACQVLKNFQLRDCEIYASCEPCPMCLGAIYWSRPARVIYANTRLDAAAIEFDDDFIYREMNTEIRRRKIQFIHHPHPGALKVFDDWKKMANKKLY